MSTETLTDVTGLINSAFQEVECIYDEQYCQHGGDKAALMVWHDCVEGFCCRGHYQFFLKRCADLLPPVVFPLQCIQCGKLFQNFDQWVRVYPL